MVLQVSLLVLRTDKVRVLDEQCVQGKYVLAA